MAENRELALVLKLVADQFNSELKKQQGALGTFGSFVKDWRVQLAAAGAVLFGIAKSTANFGDEQLKTSQKTGVNIRALGGLQFAAKLADVENVQLAQGLKFLSQNMAEAVRGTGDGEQAFKRMGISAVTATGQLRPTEAVLLDVAEAFANTADGAAKTEMATKLFGRAGMELIPFLNQGKVGIQDLMAEAEKLGLVMSEKNAKAAEKFNDDLKRLESTAQGIKLTIGTELISVFQELLDAMQGFDGQSGAKNIVEWTRVVRFGFKDLVISIAEFNAQVAVLGGNILDIFSEEKATKLGARLDRIKALADEARGAAAGDLAGVPNVVEPTTKAERTKAAADRNKKPVITTGHSKADTDALKAQLAAKEQAITDELELTKLGFERQRILAENAEKDGQASLVRMAEERARIKQQELEASAGNIQRLLILEDAGYQAQLAKFGGTATERQKLEAEHHKKVAELSQQGQVIAQQIINTKLEGEAAVREAQNQTAKQQLDLLFAGAAAIKADREAKQNDVIALAQAWLDYDQQVGVSTELRLAHHTELIAANLAKQTELTVAETQALLQHWIRHEDELADMILSKTSLTADQKLAIELRALTAVEQANEQASGDVFAGWAKGMKRYVEDTKSGFGLGADIARRMVGNMEQFFTRFFDDVLSGKIKSFKDVMRSLGDFVRQMVAMMLAQLAALAAAKAVASTLALFANTGGTVPTPLRGNSASGGSVFANAGGGIRRYLQGGHVLGTGNRDTVPALLTPGEIVLSRGDVQDIKDMDRRANSARTGADRPITVTTPEINVVVNNHSRSEVRTTSGAGSNGARQLYITIRDVTRQVIASGDADQAMHGRFKFSPRAGG